MKPFECVAYLRRIGDSPDATPGQLIEAVTGVAETRVKALHRWLEDEARHYRR